MSEATVGNGQQSEEGATRNGIQALELAFSGIVKCRQDVDSTRSGLGTGYGGSDGGQFGGLLEQWGDQTEVILANLQDMIEKLNMSLVEHGKAQGSANEAINQAYSQSQSAFDQMMG
ncbi:hypothetical protein [Streptomyces sp. NPDC001927]